MFGDRSFKEVIKLNKVIRVGSWSHMTGVLVKRGRVRRGRATGDDIGKTVWGLTLKTATCKPRTEASVEIKPWSWTFRLQNHEKGNFYCLSSPCLRYFVMAAQAIKYTWLGMKSQRHLSLWRLIESVTKVDYAESPQSAASALPGFWLSSRL